MLVPTLAGLQTNRGLVCQVATEFNVSCMQDIRLNSQHTPAYPRYNPRKLAFFNYIFRGKKMQKLPTGCTALHLESPTTAILRLDLLWEGFIPPCYPLKGTILHYIYNIIAFRALLVLTPLYKAWVWRMNVLSLARGKSNTLTSKRKYLDKELNLRHKDKIRNIKVLWDLFSSTHRRASDGNPIHDTCCCWRLRRLLLRPD